MRNFTLLFTVLTISFSFGQTNLLTNGDFETGTLTGWGGYNNQVLTDDLTGSKVGNGNNAECSTFQIVDVTPGETYAVKFDYRWVIGTGNYNLTVRVKEESSSNKLNIKLTGGTSEDGFKFNVTPGQWFNNNSFSFTAPTGITKVKLLFFKENGNRPYRIDNLSLSIVNTAALGDLAKFNFTSYPNPAKDVINLSAAKNINKIAIYNLIGQEVLSQEPNSETAAVNVDSFARGVYVVKVDIEGTVGSYRFIKE